MVGLIRDPEGKYVLSTSKNTDKDKPTDNTLPARTYSKSLGIWKETDSSEPQERKNSCLTGSAVPLEKKNGDVKAQREESEGKYSISEFFTVKTK